MQPLYRATHTLSTNLGLPVVAVVDAEVVEDVEVVVDLVAVVAVVVVVLSSCGYSDVQPIIEPYFVQCDAFSSIWIPNFDTPQTHSRRFFMGGGEFRACAISD